jgi:hypothetical protein
LESKELEELYNEISSYNKNLASTAKVKLVKPFPIKCEIVPFKIAKFESRFSYPSYRILY